MRGNNQQGISWHTLPTPIDLVHIRGEQGWFIVTTGCNDRNSIAHKWDIKWIIGIILGGTAIYRQLCLGINKWPPLSYILNTMSADHDDVIKWKHLSCYWSFVWGIDRSPVNSPRKGQWLGALMFFNMRLNKRLNKQWRGWWFETPSHPLWRHCNVNCLAWPHMSIPALGKFRFQNILANQIFMWVIIVPDRAIESTEMLIEPAIE